MKTFPDAIVAIDPSLSSTGVAVWRNGVPLQLATIAVPAEPNVVPGWTLPARIDRIVKGVAELIGVTDNTVAVIEDQIKPTAEHMRGTSTLDIARLRGAVEGMLYAHRIPLTRIHPSTLKAFAVKGGAPKSAMVAAARSYLGARYPVRTEDEADAWWLCAMALHRYVMPVVTITPARLRSMASVGSDWAPFSRREV